MFTLRPLYPRVKSPGTHWIGGWVGPTAGVYLAEKRKLSCSYRESNPDSSIVKPAASSEPLELLLPTAKVKM
jgi:hypothetical protein